MNKALILACKTKSKPYMGEDTPARFPSLQVLTRLRLVEAFYLKLKGLLKCVSADKMVRKNGTVAKPKEVIVWQ